MQKVNNILAKAVEVYGISWTTAVNIMEEYINENCLDVTDEGGTK